MEIGIKANSDVPVNNQAYADFDFLEGDSFRCYPAPPLDQRIAMTRYEFAVAVAVLCQFSSNLNDPLSQRKSHYEPAIHNALSRMNQKQFAAAARLFTEFKSELRQLGVPDEQTQFAQNELAARAGEYPNPKLGPSLRRFEMSPKRIGRLMQSSVCDKAELSSAIPMARLRNKFALKFVIFVTQVLDLRGAPRDNAGIFSRRSCYEPVRLTGILPLLIVLCFTFPANACLWDDDTLETEARGVPDAVRVITGRFERNPDLYYEMRLARVTKQLGSTPEKLELSDDAGVACDRLHRDDKAIAWMTKKRAQLDKLRASRHAGSTPHASLSFAGERRDIHRASLAAKRR